MGGMLMATQSPKIVLPVTIILIILDTCAVSLRFYARRRKKQRLLADDWLTIPALLLNIGLAVILFHGVAMHVYGYPTPIPDTPAPSIRSILPRTSWAALGRNITIAEKDEWVFFLLSILSLGCIKLSILVFYQRIFVVSKRDFRDPMAVACWAMIAIVTGWTIAFFLRYLFACGTRFDIWWTNAMRIMTECGDFNKILNVLAITDFTCDVIILLMPLPAVWKLHMPVSSKLAVSLVFALGGFAAVASMIRMIWALWQSNQHFNPDLDVQLIITTFLFWNFLEVTFALLAACIPTLRSLVSTSSLDSAIHSIRTKLSIPSLATLRSTRRSHGSRDESIRGDDCSDMSQRNILGLNTSTKATASAAQSDERMYDVAYGGIKVEKGWGAEVVSMAEYRG